MGWNKQTQRAYDSCNFSICLVCSRNLQIGACEETIHPMSLTAFHGCEIL